MSTAIVQHDPVILKLIQAGTALAEAKTIQQTKRILDVAAAAEIYAKRQKLGDDAEGIAHSIKIDALRQLGEILKDAPKNKGEKGRFRTGGTKVEPPVEAAPTLDSLGLDKKTAAVAQKLAELPENDFNQVRDGHKTVAKAIAAVSKTKPPSQDDPNENDMLVDALNSTVESLIAENENLKNHLSAGTAPEEDRESLTKRLELLTDENRKLNILNRGLTKARDAVMIENASLKKMCATYQRKIKALEK